MFLALTACTMTNETGMGRFTVCGAGEIFNPWPGTETRPRPTFTLGCCRWADLFRGQRSLLLSRPPGIQTCKCGSGAVEEKSGTGVISGGEGWMEQEKQIQVDTLMEQVGCEEHGHLCQVHTFLTALAVQHTACTQNT